MHTILVNTDTIMKLTVSWLHQLNQKSRKVKEKNLNESYRIKPHESFTDYDNTLDGSHPAVKATHALLDAMPHDHEITIDNNTNTRSFYSQSHAGELVTTVGHLAAAILNKASAVNQYTPDEEFYLSRVSKDPTTGKLHGHFAPTYSNLPGGYKKEFVEK